MNRVLVLLLALAVVAGLGVVAYFMFDESGGKKGPLDVTSGTAPKSHAQAPEIPKGAPITAKVPESVPIKTAPYVEGPGSLQEGGIMGVVQSDAGARIQDAICELFEDTSALKDRSQEGELREKQATNDQGLFYFNANALSLSERYLLKVTHPMFVTERKPVDLKKPEAGGVIYVTLRGGTAISGTVKTVAGAAIPNATVTVFDLNQNTLDPNGSIETYITADAAGFYTIGHAGPGMKKVQAAAQGFATAGRQGLNLEAGKPLANIDFILNEGGAIVGQVVSSDGTLIQGAFVTARPVRIGPKPDSDGMPPGVHEIQARREADIKAREHAVKIAEASAKDAPEDEDAKKIRTEELKEAMAQKEQMLQKEREAQKDAAVAKRSFAQPSLSNTTLSVRTQADGTYTISGTEIGSYVVSVNAPGYIPPPQQTVETPAQGVNFILQPNARIVGRVVDDETGKPVAMFTIGLTTNPDEVMIPAYSKKAFGPPKSTDGKFEYVDVKPGKFWLVADANGYAGGRSSDIVVAQGERREGVEIRLVRGSTIKGRVVDAKGAPIANATVQPEAASLSGPQANPFIGVLTQSMRRDVREVKTDSDGRFVLPNMLGGSYTLNVRHPDFGPHISAPFAVQGSGEMNVPDVVMSRGASVRGRILLPDGQPDTKAMVQVSPVGTTPNFSAHRSAYTNSEGRFEVTGLAVGQYRIIVAQRNGTPDISSLFKGLAQGQAQSQNLITLSEGEQKEIDL